MKNPKNHSIIILTGIVSLVLATLFYNPYTPHYYEVLIKDITPRSMVEIRESKDLIYAGYLGDVGMACLSSYKQKNRIPTATSNTFKLRIWGASDEHYITLNALNGEVHSYLLWDKISQGSYSVKAEKVDLSTRCSVTMRGFVDNS